MKTTISIFTLAALLGLSAGAIAAGEAPGREEASVLASMTVLGMPEELKPGKVSSEFPLAGGDSLVLNGSWVVFSKEAERQFQLVPFDDLEGKRVRMLVVSSDKVNSELEMASRLLKAFREKSCNDAEPLTAETIPKVAELIKTSEGAAFFSACAANGKVMFYVIDAHAGKGKMWHGIIFGVDEPSPDSVEEINVLGTKAMRAYQSLFLKVSGYLGGNTSR